MLEIINRKILFLLLAILIGNIGASYAQPPSAKRGRVKLKYVNPKLYTICNGHTSYIGEAQYKPGSNGDAPEALLDPAGQNVFYARTTGCGYESEGMTLFRSDIYGRKSVPILSSCELLSPARILEFDARSYLLIEQGDVGMPGISFWLYDVNANTFVLHAEGEIMEKRKGILSYMSYPDGQPPPTVRRVTIKNLVNRESPLRLLPRGPIQASTLRRNTKVFLSGGFCSLRGSDQYKVIRKAGTNLLVAGPCPDGAYEIYYNGIRGQVMKGSLKLLR